MTLSIQCPSCKHYQGSLKCAAFPERIPSEIMTGEFDHTKPYQGDNGIRWEPVDEKAREMMAYDEDDE